MERQLAVEEVGCEECGVVQAIAADPLATVVKVYDQFPQLIHLMFTCPQGHTSYCFDRRKVEVANDAGCRTVNHAADLIRARYEFFQHLAA